MTKKNEPTPTPENDTLVKIEEELAAAASPADDSPAGTLTGGLFTADKIHAPKEPEPDKGTLAASGFVPAVARIVHYQSGDSVVAALITAVNDEGEGDVALTLFHPHGSVAKPSVKFSEKPTDGFWNVPPRT